MTKIKFMLLATAIVVGNAVAGASKETASDAARLEGGIVQIGGKGRIAVLDFRGSQSSAAEECREAVRPLETMSHVKFSYAAKNIAFDIAKASKYVLESEGNAAVFVVDDTTLPMTLSAVEAGWALVNVAALRDEPGGIVPPRRLGVALRRAACRTMGLGVARGRDSFLGPARNCAELDALAPDGMTMDAAMSIMAYLPTIGIERYERMTYKEACEEGIAPAPTNEVQRAIWKKYKK